MKKTLIIAGIVGLVAHLVSGLGTATVSASDATDTVLIYEVAPNGATADVAAPDMDKILKAINHRLNSGLKKLAQVRKLNDQRIEVVLMDPNGKDRQHIEGLLSRPGTLEFRILANERDNRILIEQARKDPSKSEVLDSSGKRLAWWVPVKFSEEKGFVGQTDIVRRTKKQNNHEVVEILVVADSYNVTGAYLTKAQEGIDRREHYCLNFIFNDAGGKLFAKLTGDHLPDASTGFKYRLGIIVDGELYSAPVINGVIGNLGVIEGSFTKEQVSDLAYVLNSGSLPVRLRMVPKAGSRTQPPPEGP